MCGVSRGVGENIIVDCGGELGCMERGGSLGRTRITRVLSVGRRRCDRCRHKFERVPVGCLIHFYRGLSISTSCVLNLSNNAATITGTN